MIVGQLVSLLENVYNALRRFHVKETETLERIGSRTLLPRELFGEPPERNSRTASLGHWQRTPSMDSSSSSSETSTQDPGLTPDARYEDLHHRWNIRSPAVQAICPRLHPNQGLPSRDELIYRFNRKSLSRLVVITSRLKSKHTH